MSKCKVKVLALMSVLIATLLIIGGLNDLALSESLYEGQRNILALMGGFFGKLPAFLMLAFGFVVLYDYVKVNSASYKKSVSVILRILYAIAILGSFVLAFYSAFDEITSKAKILGVAAGGLVALITLYIITKRDLPHLEELKKWSILTIISVVVIILLVLLLKTVWGRARYQVILDGSAEYSPWYIPKGVTGGNSFPSGHTALWGALYMLVPLIGVFDRKGQTFTFVLILLSQIMVGLFRMVGGFHFLSDITFSIAISFFTSFTVSHIGYKDDYSNKTLSSNNIFRRI